MKQTVTLSQRDIERAVERYVEQTTGGRVVNTETTITAAVHYGPYDESPAKVTIVVEVER